MGEIFDKKKLHEVYLSPCPSNPALIAANPPPQPHIIVVLKLALHWDHLENSKNYLFLSPEPYTRCLEVIGL